MIFAALVEAATKGELILCEGGMCRWHLRRDKIVVIREIIVLPEQRRQGIGRALVNAIQARNPGAVLLAKCPREYSSNSFWPRLGFVLTAQGERVNEWRLPSA